MTGSLAAIPERAGAAAATVPSDIQFDVGAVTAPVTTVNGVQVAFPPVHTIFLTAVLSRTPTAADQHELARVLAQLEASYPWGATGLITHLAYGVPYFARLDPTIVGAAIPRTLADHTRSALQEAVPTTTDVVPGNGIEKSRFQIPVRIERNDVLFTLRSDTFSFLQDVLNWFAGSNRLRGMSVSSPRWANFLSVTTTRHMFVQRGLPRSVAVQNNLPFARFMQPDSPMWMGFADQQTSSAGPPEICTFAGNSSAKLTDSAPGRYFDNGAIQHLSHNLIDMAQWFGMEAPTAAPAHGGAFAERVQYMFHAPGIDPGNADQFTDGGGPAFLPSDNRGPDYARLTAQGIGTARDPATGRGERRLGHLSAMQRSSRAGDGTPLHLRLDGPGFDHIDVPDGSAQPKLEFSAFVATADFFATMRANGAAQDLAEQYGVGEDGNGLERFLTATRRQNYLIPPRRHRAFPLVEVGG